MQESIFVRDLAVVLIAAAAFGWTAQQARLSAVVGYLVAGVVIGPFSPVFKVVSNTDHIQLLSQIGLVFLMFSIGLGLSFARLQRMGLSIVGAVAMSAILLFNICRGAGSILGWSSIEVVFLAGTLMISSSAIIIKVLDELNIMHQRAGQLALGMTVLEDIVAVVMLTIFVSMIKIGANSSVPLWSVLGAVSAFVVFLIVVAMLFVPRILAVLSRDAGSDLRVTAVTGLVLMAAVAAYAAGYSLALGAFVMGVVVAGTRFKDELENAFGPLHVIFGSVFFVSVGMIFDYKLLATVWPLVLAITALTVVARPFACAAGLVGVGHTSRNAIKAGITLIPVGEFAFVMIQIGKSGNVLPEKFYALGIGVSLATAVIGPLLTRRAEGLSIWIDGLLPKPLHDAIEIYHGWLDAFQARSSGSVLWRLTSKRVFHTGFHLLFVSGLILMARPAYRSAYEHYGAAHPLVFGMGFWILVFVVLLGPLIVLWRNMEAIAMILADGLTSGSSWSRFLRPILETLLKGVAAGLLLGWILLLAPVGKVAIWTLGIAVAIILLYAPRFWKRLVMFHSRAETELRQKMKAAATLGSSTGLPDAVLEEPQRWNLQIDEVVLPLGSEHAGRRIADLGIRKKFGSSIMAIERQGFLIGNPSAEERLFSGDKVLLLGTPEQLSGAEQFLRGVTSRAARDDIEAITMETMTLPATSGHLGQTLAEVNPVGRFGVQICGVERGGQRILGPSSEERLQPADTLLLLGSHENIRAFGSYLSRQVNP